MRQGHYGEGDINAMIAAQLKHYQAQQGQEQQGAGFPGLDSFQSSEEHHRDRRAAYSKWDQDAGSVPGQHPPYAYNEGQGNEGSRLYYDVHRSDSKVGPERSASRDPRGQSLHDKIDAGFDGNMIIQSFEGLEKKIHDDIAKLIKEHEEAEDVENSRHRERLNEINAQYQEKLLNIRVHQANYREEILRKESQLRYQQYQQTSMSINRHILPPSAAAARADTAGALALNLHKEQNYSNEQARAYAGGQYEAVGERTEFGGGRDRHGESQPRGQYPGGRAYNSGGRRF